MDIPRPAKRVESLSWSMNKVLDLLVSQPYSDQNCPLQLLQQKTAFLLSLACGARISEVVSLRRGANHVQKRGEDLLLTPGVSLLAKNENPESRRGPIHIKALAQDKVLCPVTTLNLYLEKTAQYADGPLF